MVEPERDILGQSPGKWGSKLRRRFDLEGLYFVTNKTLEVKKTNFNFPPPPPYYMIAVQCPLLILTAAHRVTIDDVLDHNLHICIHLYLCTYCATVGCCRTS